MQNNTSYTIFDGTDLGAERHGGLIYRLYHKSLSKSHAYNQYSFSFVDIVVLNDRGSNYKYSSNEARIYWPPMLLSYGCFDRFVDVQFGHLTLRILSTNDTKQHLNDNCGKDWPYVA
ncbi:unnamed protein product [Rotaria sordida]|uniref:Uncharacterized protein n=1 Tax=Rotaria sordida TaxID=392033 RepID=A0A819D5Y5_9BILA|nr:unnamed protein product [Rotaria sordida]CAF1170196.1 unnamed protein product [Rotaria sordida]CAF3831264.1 unnamed protein product [Rotaria sordida]CAF4155996.1 unnamed protein product [Rotaria sordida]